MATVYGSLPHHRTHQVNGRRDGIARALSYVQLVIAATEIDDRREWHVRTQDLPLVEQESSVAFRNGAKAGYHPVACRTDHRFTIAIYRFQERGVYFRRCDINEGDPCTLTETRWNQCGPRIFAHIACLTQPPRTISIFLNASSAPTGRETDWIPRPASHVEIVFVRRTVGAVR